MVEILRNITSDNILAILIFGLLGLGCAFPVSWVIISLLQRKDDQNDIGSKIVDTIIVINDKGAI